MSAFQQSGLRHPISRVTTSGATTTLINTSNVIQYFDGTMTQIVSLPNATGMKSGRGFYIANRSTGFITIKDFAATTLQLLPPNTDTWINPIDISTSAGVWDVSQGLGGGGGGGTAGFSHISIAGLTSNYPNGGGDAPIIWDTVVYDPEGAYNVSTGEYTVSQTGFLLVTCQAQLTTGATELSIKINGTIFSFLENATGNDASMAIIFQVNAGDLITIGSQSAATFTGNSPYVNLVSFAQIPNAFAESRIVVSTGNGFGSVNTPIRRFSSVDINVGTDITYADSATDGASFTINSDGVYAITIADHDTTNNRYTGISRNSSTPTQTIDLVTILERLLITVVVAGGIDGGSWTGKLSQGDIIRHHGDGSANSNTGVSFVIERIG